jgi:TonB family protein
MEGGFWLADGMTAFSPTPARSARQLRKSGALNLSVATGPEPDSPLDQYTFELPAASASVDRVLESCGAPMTDARDDLPRWNPPRSPSSSMWNRRPVPDFPASALSAGINSGFAILSCVVGAQGQFLDCRIERESHRRAGFGDAALRSMRAARLSLTDGQAPRVGDLIVSTIRFRAS